VSARPQTTDSESRALLDPRLIRFLPWIDIGCFGLAILGMVLVFLGLQGADSARLNLGIGISAIAVPVGLAAQVADWYVRRKKR
jgi:hypothetical protein